jgi:hypothetical protein
MTISTSRKAAVAACCLVLCLPPVAAGAGEPAGGEGLVVQMSHMQRFLHKLDLAVQADNAELAGFYIHELEELAEGIADSGVVYYGHEVGALTGSTLPPAIEAVEKALEAGGDADSAVAALVEQCNACHEATDRAWLKIVRASGNPFNQDFRP